MKNLLMITQNYYPEIGSAANRMKNIKQLLAKHHFGVTVLTTEPSYPNRHLYQNNDAFWSNDEDFEENVVRIHPKVRKYTHNMFKRLLLYLEVTLRFFLILLKLEKKFDFIFVSSPPIFMGIAGLFAKRRFKVPLILDVRDLWPESLHGVGVFTYGPLLRIAYLLEEKLYKHADHIIINSDSFRSYILSKGVSPDKISFMPNSLTERELAFSPDSELHPNDTRVSVVYTGNIGLAQDLQKFVCVAENLKDRKDIQFKIIGYGYRKPDIVKQIEEKKLSNIAIYHPKNREDTMLEVGKSDIAYVSLSEKSVFQTVLPGKMIDYMCMAKPVVGDVSGYCSGIIRHADCGYVAENRDVEQLTRHIETLSNDRLLRERLGGNGYRYACQKLRWKKNIRVLLNILEGLNEKENMHVRVESFYE
ncbi:hypothetical protein EV207_10792 [Scopulibacillus darangshiensis]|uniref:Glycosyltransferase involved in cell wall biosynthesis n=1 Tax=Scopulibacillus darangshiensis TaxID=442528 RepID=A0A4R2P6Y2_9BACL|nr:glycosyltransferase family 4 protein [Scopulibacillus darangshiensis]TCP29998.1 hypothetical protein EV207_10792 [Scopulibacillus darangshiensis]